MDVRYVNPFIAAIKAVFATMLDTDVVINKPHAETCGHQTADVSVVVGLSGDAVGSVALCFPMNSAVKAASKFARVEMSKDHEDFTDALGELANMVTGHAKSQLEGLDCSISLPSVIVGQGHVVSHSKATPRIALPCDSALGTFCVAVGMTVAKREARVQPCEVV